MIKKITLLLLLVSMMIPMTLSAQEVRKDVLTNLLFGKDNRSLLKKNVPAPADKRVQKLSDFTKSMRRAPKAEANTWDFESEAQLNEWTLVDSDGDGFNWEYHNNEGLTAGIMAAHSGEGLVFSASYDNENSTSLTPDNWLISPEVTLGGVLSFWAWGQDPDWSREVFGVFVCVGNSTNPADFVPVGSDKTATGEMTEYTFDLSQYAGQTGRFAIRHYNVTDMFYLNIDDVCLDINAAFIPDPTNPTNLTVDPTATTADVAWNGAEGDSWNLRYRVYNPNEKQTILWDLTIDNYESQIADWGTWSNDDDDYNWGLSYSDFDPTGTLGEEKNVCFYSESYSNYEALTPDNWLYTPELELGGTFKFWAQNDKYPDVLGVFVETDEGTFQIGDDITPPEDWTEYIFNTSDYAGQNGYIVIRHYNCSDQFRIFVDYISYETSGDEPAEWIVVNGLTAPNYTIEGLEPGTDYVVEVQAYTENGTTDWSEPTYFTTLEGIGVSMSAVGYATLYYGNMNLVVPQGVEASAITVESGSMTKSQVYAAGDIIPQGTGVLIQAQQGDYIFRATSEEGTAPAANMLRGSDEAEETTGGDIYLMLSLNAKSDPNSVGFYYGAENGAPFTNGAHKAYLALQSEQAAGARYVWFETSGISGIETADNNATDVYTVTGVHVNRLSGLSKGIYIVGGKKVIVK